MTADFGNTTYDWDNMVAKPTVTSSPEQQNAVAVLSYHCGVSLDMQYGNLSSGAYPSAVAGSLTTYFGYSNDIMAATRDYYTDEQWKLILKEEINAGRPILYSGWDVYGGGHGFICDGYDNNDYFHFNWGWSGSCDGYYAIGYLSPGQGGIGAGSGCYNESNYILLNVEPKSASVGIPENVTASVNGRDVTINWNHVPGVDHYKVYRDGFVVNECVVGTSYYDQNVFYGQHEYRVRSVNSNGIYSHASDPAIANVVFPGPVPTNLATSVDNGNVSLSWTAPASESAVLKYGDGNPSSAIGYGSPTPFYWGQCYKAEQLVQYAGMAIQSVEVFHRDIHTYTLHVYSLDEGDLVEVYTQSYNTTSANSWYTVTLSSPCVIDYANDIYIVLSSEDLSYPAVYTQYNGNQNAALYGGNGYSFNNLNNVSWLMRTNITDGTYTYNIYRNGDMIASNKTQTTYADNGLSGGTYNYTVKTNYYGGLSDASNTATATIPGLLISATGVNPACHGGNDGFVEALASGGTPPYVYNMAGQVSPSTSGSYVFNGISAGTYTVSVQDNAGVTASKSVTLNDPAEVVVTISGNTNIIEGQSTTLTASGAATYEWSTGATTQSITVSPATSTTYSVVGTSAAGCTGDAQVTVVVSDSNISLFVDEVSNVTCHGGSDGAVTVTVQEGFAPYVYSIGTQSYGPTGSATHTFQNLAAGTYEMSVTDDIGNTATATATVSQPAGLQPGSIGTSGETLCFGDSPSAIPSEEDATSDQSEVTYRWKVNGSEIPGSNMSEYTPDNVGVGTHVFTREAKDDCTGWTASSGEWTLVVIEEVEVTISGNTTIMAGESTMLTASGAATYEWSTGETTASITVMPTEDTEYSVTGFVGDCSDVETVTVTVMPDAIGENTNDLVRIYPNPAKEFVYVSCENMKDISVLTIDGRRVDYLEPGSDVATIDVTKLKVGTYLILIRGNDGSIIRRSLVVYYE